MAVELTRKVGHRWAAPPRTRILFSCPATHLPYRLFSIKVTLTFSAVKTLSSGNLSENINFSFTAGLLGVPIHLHPLTPKQFEPPAHLSQASFCTYLFPGQHADPPTEAGFCYMCSYIAVLVIKLFFFFVANLFLVKLQTANVRKD